MENAWISGDDRGFSFHDAMNTSLIFPRFDDHFPDLNGFILELAEAYEAGQLNSWADLKARVSAFYTAERMEQMEADVPGWGRMASYSEAVTLTHVMCVFLGLVLLREFQSLSPDEQQLAKWIVLFHDVEKDLKNNQRDMKHGFRSAVTAARQLPKLGFAVTPEYEQLIASWSKLTYFAIKNSSNYPEPVQDNDKLPNILSGIERMFGKDVPATLIVKSVLLHMSINILQDWPQAAPLSETEIENYIDSNLMRFLKVMMLADNEGWSIFDPVSRAQQRKETLGVFQEIEKLLSSESERQQ